MSNPILRNGFRTAQPVGVVTDQWGRQQQVPMDPYAAQQAWAQPQARMTLDDVLVKSMCSIGLMIMVATCTFMLLPDVFSASAAAGIGSLGAFVMSIVVAARRQVGVVAALLFAAVEGVAIGAVSRVFEAFYPGIVPQAVLGTFLAAGVTLAAFRFFRIKVGSKLRRGITIGIIAYSLSMLVSWGLSMIGVNLGLFDRFGDVSVLGLVMTGVGTVLAILALLTDFDDIQRGIQGGAPATESWRAAFGLTVTMVWLYTHVLRILSYLRN